MMIEGEADHAPSPLQQELNELQGEKAV